MKKTFIIPQTDSWGQCKKCPFSFEKYADCYTCGGVEICLLEEIGFNCPARNDTDVTVEIDFNIKKWEINISWITSTNKIHNIMILDETKNTLEGLNYETS